MAAFSSDTLGRVLSSPGSIIAVMQIAEQIPHLVQRFSSTIIVSIDYPPLYLPIASISLLPAYHASPARSPSFQ
jgi:hypothetical protein